MDHSPTAGFPQRLVWLLVLLGLFVWQAWMTLTLFAPPERTATTLQETARQCWQRLRDDQPIVAGRHPLHLYHGHLGAQSLHERGTLCCYDPSFQVGYAKTPVFDSGSRPAELFLFLAGGSYRPAAYKMGLAICSLLVPVFLTLAARSLGLGWGASSVAVALGMLVCWGGPCRASLEEGDLDLLLAGLAGVAYSCLLVSFHCAPGMANWLGLVICAVLGWFAQPFLFLLLFPLVLLYYLSAGSRHQLGWHLALLASLVAALAANNFWLQEWVRSWWIRVPLQLGAEPLRHRTFQTLWSASLWGDAADRLLAAVLFVLAALGVILLNQSRQRPAARLLGLGAGGFLALAIAGIAWQPLGRLGASQLFLPALWFAVLPAAYALARVHGWVEQGTRSYWCATAWCVTVLIAVVLGSERQEIGAMARATQTTPLALGLGEERTALVGVLRSQTDGSARILWEERPGKGGAARWSALLPLLTDRAFLGGLDPDGCIEHSYSSLIDQSLAGRPLTDWSNADLEDYCRRYNIGWTVCWSSAAIARFRALPGAVEEVTVHDEGPGVLFRLPPQSFVLKGQARWLCANRQRIALADVVPEDGKIVLSLHYQAGLQVSPGRVQIEREPDLFDPIPFIRLRVPGPVARVILTWEER